MALYRILERRRGAVWVCILVIYFAAFLFVASADEMNDDTEYQKKLAKMGKKAEAAAKKKRKVDAKLANRVIKAGECGDHVSNTLSASRYSHLNHNYFWSSLSINVVPSSGVDKLANSISKSDT